MQGQASAQEWFFLDQALSGPVVPWNKLLEFLGSVALVPGSKLSSKRAGVHVFGSKEHHHELHSEPEHSEKNTWSLRNPSSASLCPGSHVGVQPVSSS